MELLLVAGALALASQQSAKPVAAKPAAPPTPAPKPPTQPPVGYLDACWQYGVKGATVGFTFGPEGAAVGGAAGCAYGVIKNWWDS